MLGPPKLRCLDVPITVSLEDLVPQDHFYRHLEAKLDLSFVRGWVKELYAERGRPSIDPVIFFKLQLVMFFEGMRSERQLTETASLHLAHRWYLGYALDEVLPDHSSLTRIRQRLGVDIFQRFFEQVVDLCQEAGLVWGRELYFDATRVRADADTDSLVPRFYADAKAHVADIFAEHLQPQNEPAASPAHGLLHLPVETGGTVSAPQEPGATRWNLLEERRLAPGRPSHRGYRRTSDFWISTTDPDATPMWTDGKARLGYHDHYVVDGGKRRIILAALVTPADVMENQPMLDLLWRVRFRRKLHPQQATGDTTYGTVENIVALEDAGIRAYVPLPDMNHRRPFFGQDDFAYDAAQDAYRAQQVTCWPASGSSTPRASSFTGLIQRPATPAHSRWSARKAAAAGSPTARSMPSTWTRCAATTRRRSTRRPCGSDKCGWSLSSPRPSSGTGCAASGGAGWRTSISRGC
jgi:transposase